MDHATRNTFGIFSGDEPLSMGEFYRQQDWAHHDERRDYGVRDPNPRCASFRHRGVTEHLYSKSPWNYFREQAKIGLSGKPLCLLSGYH
jgi:hypothetical protein